MCPTGTTAAAIAKGGSDIRSAFDVLDADRDGKISRADLLTFYEGFSGAGAPAEDVIGTMISVADSNEDGFVEYEEFERVLKEREGDDQVSRGAGVMKEAFRVMDRDGDGLVGQEDLRSYLKWAGFETSDEDIKAMIKLGGGDESQGVTYDGLLKILAV